MRARSLCACIWFTILIRCKWHTRLRQITTWVWTVHGPLVPKIVTWYPTQSCWEDCKIWRVWAIMYFNCFIRLHKNEQTDPHCVTQQYLQLNPAEISSVLLVAQVLRLYPTRYSRCNLVYAASDKPRLFCKKSQSSKGGSVLALPLFKSSNLS